MRFKMKYRESEDRNLWLYFLIAFVFSWLFWAPQALISTGLLSAPSILANFLFSPFVSAISLSYLSKGVEEVKDLLKRGVDYRFKAIWYIPIFCLFP